MGQDNTLSLSDHLEEFRNRVIKSVAFIFVFTLAVYAFVNRIIPVFVKPVGKLVFIAPQEAFVTNIKIAFFAGAFIAAPFVLYQVWRFVASALLDKEKKYLLIFGPLSFLFFLAGTVFCYVIIIPISLKFLLGFSSEYMVPFIGASKYVSFVGSLVLVFGVVFELPLASLFLTKVGLVTPDFLSKKRRHALVIIFIVSAIITPPDVVTQCMMALPLIILFEIGILFSKLVYKPI